MSSRPRAIVAAFFGMVLAACAPVAPSVDTGPANSTGAAGVAVREHLSGRYIALIGPKAQHDPLYLDMPETNFFCLRSFIDRQTGKTATSSMSSPATIPNAIGTPRMTDRDRG